MSKVEPLWGRDFVETYIKRGEQQSRRNQHMHLAGMLSLIGQSINKVIMPFSDMSNTIDGRVHPFIFQTSGTGKGEAFKFINRVASEAGIPFVEEEYVTTAAMVGTVGEGGEVTYGDLYHPGQGNGIVGWEEANILLQSGTNAHSRDLKEHLNKAMNPDGVIRRSLANNRIEYTTNKSLYCCTYIPDIENVDISALMNTGFFPRMLIYYKKKGMSFHNELWKERADSLGFDEEMNKPLLYQDEYIRDIKGLGKTLRLIQKKVKSKGQIYKKSEGVYTGRGRDVFFFGFSREAKERIKRRKALKEVLDGCSPSTKEIASKAISRWMNYLIKVSACMAAIDKCSETVRKDHVKRAEVILKESWKDTLKLIDTYKKVWLSSKERKLQQRIKDLITANGNLIEVRDIVKDTDAPLSTITDALNNLETKGVIKTPNEPKISYDTKVKKNE